ncbi:MAG: family 78 glycoside hydrolase catalytic domain [Lentisphaerota bacterium]
MTSIIDKTFTGSSVAGIKLLVEFDPSPDALDIPDPRFSWALPVKGRLQKQTGYRILVASSSDLLAEDRADLWDSGEVQSSQSINIYYAGRPLASDKDYFWKVKIGDSSGQSGSFSQIGKFSTALLNPGDWKALWIGCGKTDEIVADVDTFTSKQIHPDVMRIEPDLRSPLLRKEFSLTKPVRRARAFVCGLGLYELRLNGHKGGSRVLTPSRTDYRKTAYYDTYDISAKLKAGLNVLGIILGNGFFNSPKKFWDWRMQWYGSPRVICQLHIEYMDGTLAVLVTDNSWKTAFAPIMFNCVFDGEDYDARQEQPGWDSPGFDDCKWTAANVVAAPGGKLASAMHDPSTIVQTVRSVSISQPQPDLYVYDMGQNFAGWVRLNVKGACGTKVKMRYAESINNDGMIVPVGVRAEDNYILKGDDSEIYEPRFTYHGFQYVEVSGFPGTPSLDSLEGCFVHNAVPLTGAFDCGNELINRIHACTVQTQRNNLQSGVPTDCPQRGERLGWGADGWIPAEESMLNFHMPRFYAKWMRDFRDSQTSAGLVGMIVPRAGVEEDLVWSCAYVFIPWEQYRHYGDLRILANHYDSLVKYMDYLENQGRAEIKARPIGTNPLSESAGQESQLKGHLQRSQWGDHLALAEGFSGRSGLPFCISTAFYFRDACVMEQIANALGSTGDARKYARLANNIRDAFNQKFLNKALKYYDDGSQASQAFVIDFGLSPTDYEEDVFNRILNDLAQHQWHLTTGYPGTKSLIDALTAKGRPDIVWKLANQTGFPSWHDMIKDKRTTLNEHWEPSRGSHNHVALGAPLDAWFFTVLAGIQCDDACPGYEKIVIKPYIPEDLDWVTASIDTIRGVIKSAWKKENGNLNIKVTIPANSSARLYIPISDRSEIKESGKAAAESEGVQYISTENGCAIFDVGSGEYDFVRINIKHMKEE